MKPAMMFSATLCVLLSWPTGGSPVGKYGITKKVVEGHTTYHLVDSSRKMDFGVAPDIGFFGYEFKVNGKDVLIPPESFRTYLEKRWFCCGSPILWPWTGRIPGNDYFFQSRKYLLNTELGNLLVDAAGQPLHGLLVFDPRWEVIKTSASDAQGASLTARLEFYKYPDLMAQFPFAHTIEVTYRLKDGKLETRTKVENVGRAPMPVHLGYHPYFRPDGPREEWTFSIAAKKHLVLSKQLTPTGEMEPMEKFVPRAKNFVLARASFDDVFSDLERELDGLAHFWVKGATGKVEIVFGKEFDFAVVYAPTDKPVVCIEPWTAPPNAFNLNHEGKYPGLMVLEPGKTFTGSFWIIPSGY